MSFKEQVTCGSVDFVELTILKFVDLEMFYLEERIRGVLTCLCAHVCMYIHTFHTFSLLFKYDPKITIMPVIENNHVLAILHAILLI